MNLELVKKQREAKGIYTYIFNKPPAIRYNAGEYIELSLNIAKPDARGSRRWFTLSSAPSEKNLAITTKFPASGQRISSFKTHLKSLSVGSKVQISPPMGDFILPHNTGREIVFIAGGIGITPYRSMLKFIYDEKLEYKIQLIYSARTAKEFIFIDLLQQISTLKLTRVVSEPDDNWRGESGILNIKKITRLADGLANKLVYLAGPEGMVEMFEKELLTIGHPKTLIKTDFFPGYKGI